MTDTLTAKGLYKIYGDNPEAALKCLDEGLTKEEIHQRTGQVVGVKDASFTVRQGEIFVIMGLSGCGKSTLVRMLNRLIEPTRGQVFSEDREITALRHRELINLRRRDFAMVFQSFALLPHLSVRENAAFGLEIAGVAEPERSERATAALETVGLAAFAEARPDTLSGGMQQRVGLARALAPEPSILLMDEAFSALDPVIRTEMQDELLAIQRREARSIVFISHDLDEAMRIGDRIAVMSRDGEIVQIGTPEEILQDPENQYVRSFFHGVDVSKVLTARHVCRDEGPRLAGAAAGDAAQALDALKARNAACGYLVDDDGRFRAVVRRDTLDHAVAAGRALDTALDTDIAPVAGGTSVRDLMPKVAAAPVPLPVVDRDGRYLGAVSAQALLEAMAEND